MKYLCLLSILLTAYSSLAQCDSEVCNGNTGIYSNDDATNIAYDNIGSAYHSTYIREPNGGWKVWGENMGNSGFDNELSPKNINNVNYPALTGTIYKVAMGSSGINEEQLIVLTSTGLFVLGQEGTVLASSITTSTTFQKITINGKTDGLPLNISPQDVKMLFASAKTLMITTCSGQVYALSDYAPIRGNGGGGSSILWSQVMQDAQTPLSNVIVSRGTTNVGFALKADGTLWTWGQNSLLGNGTPVQIRNYATQMTLPAGIPGIKMILGTNFDFEGTSYYVLGTDKKVYSLGDNSAGQLGDRTSIMRTSWVNAKNPDTSIITDAAWISTNEHDDLFPALALIKTGGILYTAGYNGTFMIGRTINGGVNYLALPNGIAATDVITQAEVGGHTCALIKQGSIRYGYVGHRINGSLGNGSNSDQTIESYDFITPPIIAVCGTICTQPVLLASNNPICDGSNAVFTITASPGDTITYRINNGVSQTIVTDATGQAQVTVMNPTASQNIQLTFILGAGGTCSNFLSQTNTVNVGGNVVPIFNQAPQICAGETLSPLPTVSLNAINGSWSPALNNAETTTYTFTPANTGCASATTMTISVIPANTLPLFTQIAPGCFNEPLNALPTTSDNGITGDWSPAVNNQTTTTYTFTPSTLGACIPSTTMTIQILLPVTPLFNQLAPVCAGDSFNLPTVSTNGISGSWNPAANNQQTTTYTFTGDIGSCAQNSSMTVQVNAKATPVFQPVAPICEGSFLADLPLISDNGISGIWSPALNNQLTTTYTFTPDTGVCANPTSAIITVNTKINPVFPDFDTVCFGDSAFALPIVSNNNIAGTWQPGFNNTHSGSYTFVPAETECANPATVQVAVFQDFDFNLSRFCEDGILYLQVVSASGNFDTGSASIEWQYNNATIGNTETLNLTSYLQSTATVETLPISFTALVTNQDGCKKSKTITLQSIFCDIQKGISPNGDHLNDFFDLRLLNVSHLSIFNRYGMKVYSKGNYLDEWHGQTDDGSDLPDAAYYYRIDFRNEPSKTGWIYLNTEN